MSRTLPAIILLAIAASTALAGVHVATHATVNPGECELCSAYNDPSDAIPSGGVSVPAGALQSQDRGYGGSEHTQPAVLRVRQRSPPASI